MYKEADRTILYSPLGCNVYVFALVGGVIMFQDTIVHQKAFYQPYANIAVP